MQGDNISCNLVKINNALTSTALEDIRDQCTSNYIQLIFYYSSED